MFIVLEKYLNLIIVYYPDSGYHTYYKSLYLLISLIGKLEVNSPGGRYALILSQFSG